MTTYCSVTRELMSSHVGWHGRVFAAMSSRQGDTCPLPKIRLWRMGLPPIKARATKLSIFSAILSALILMVAVGPVESAPTTQKAPKISNTTRASCLLKITCDPATLPLDYEMLDFLLRSSGVAGQAARDVFGEAGAKVYDQLEENEVIRFTPLTPAAKPKAPVERRRTAGRAKPRGGGRPGMGMPGMGMPGMGPMMDDEFGPGSIVARPGRHPRSGRTPITTPDEEVLVGRLQIDLVGPIDAISGLKPAAEEFMAAICSRLREAIVETHERYMEQLENRLGAAHRRADDASERLAKLQATQREFSQDAGQADLSRENITKTISASEKEKQKLEMELAGLQARREAIEKQIAKVGGKVSAKLKDDPVAKELQTIVELRKEKVAWLEKLVGSGRAPQFDLVDARAELAQAKMELARRREEIRQAGGDEVARKLNEELAELSIQTAELEGRLKHINTQLKNIKAKELLELADRYEREVALQLPLAFEAAESAMRWRDELERQMKTARAPVVTVIGGADNR